MCATRVTRLPGFRFETQAPVLSEVLGRRSLCRLRRAKPLQVGRDRIRSTVLAIFGGCAAGLGVTRGEQLYALSRSGSTSPFATTANAAGHPSARQQSISTRKILMGAWQLPTPHPHVLNLIRVARARSPRHSPAAARKAVGPIGYRSPRFFFPGPQASNRCRLAPANTPFKSKMIRATSLRKAICFA